MGKTFRGQASILNGEDHTMLLMALTMMSAVLADDEAEALEFVKVARDRSPEDRRQLEHEALLLAVKLCGGVVIEGTVSSPEDN